MVTFGTEEREVINLIRSGIQHQGIILIAKNGTAYFKCDHAVTDLVFEDMIDLDTRFAQWNNP